MSARGRGGQKRTPRRTGLALAAAASTAGSLRAAAWAEAAASAPASSSAASSGVGRQGAMLAHGRYGARRATRVPQARAREVKGFTLGSRPRRLSDPCVHEDGTGKEQGRRAPRREHERADGNDKEKRKIETRERERNRKRRRKKQEKRRDDTTQQLDGWTRPRQADRQTDQRADQADERDDADEIAGVAQRNKTETNSASSDLWSGARPRAGRRRTERRKSDTKR